MLLSQNLAKLWDLDLHAGPQMTGCWGKLMRAAFPLLFLEVLAFIGKGCSCAGRERARKTSMGTPTWL